MKTLLGLAILLQIGLGAVTNLPQPMDVPPITTKRLLCKKGDTVPCAIGMHCTAVEDQYQDVQTCADKSRILLTGEDGVKHCVTFAGR